MLVNTVLTNSLEILRIIIFIVILFVLTPMLIKKPEKGEVIERLVKGFCVSTFSGILITYFLTIMHLFDIFSFLILFFPVTALIYFWVEEIKLRDLNIKARMINFAVKLFDRIEKGSPKKLIVGNPKPSDSFFRKPFVHLASKIIFACAAGFVFLYAFSLRLREIITHTFLYYSDSYGHLMIAKLFLLGNIMQEKFYPLGYHSIIADIKLVSFSDLVDIIRFLGPIQSVLIILSIYFFVFMVTKNKYAALLAAAVFGLDSLDIWPLVFYRQLVALPQEFATIFFLPALYFCMEYIKNRENKYLKYFFIVLSNIILIHEYVGMLVFWGVLGVAAVGVILRLWRKTAFLKFTLAGFASCVLGALPFIIWALAGIIFGLPNRQGEIIPDGGFLYRYVNFHVTAQDLISFLCDAVNPFKDPLKWHNQISANIIIYSLAIAMVYLFTRRFLRKRFFDRHFYLLALAIGQLFFVLFYYGFEYNLISIMYFERIGLILSICGVSIIGLLFNELYNLVYPLKGIAILSLSIYAVIAGMVIGLPYEKTETVVYQHEGALKAYCKIRENYEFLDWTVVSPVEELSEVYGYGYHYELWKFVQEFKLSDAKNRDFDFGQKIPSENIFIFVEKDPLLVWYTIPPTVYQVSEAEKYYRMYHERKRLEKQISEWIEEYRKSHYGLSDDAEVFYEDKDIVVFYIQHKINKK